MSAKQPMMTEEARLFMKQHDLGFLDMCELVLAFSELINGGIKWEHGDGRCVIQIKPKTRKMLDREKEAAREADQLALESGEKTVAQLHAENTFLPLDARAPIDYRKVPPLR